MINEFNKNDIKEIKDWAHQHIKAIFQHFGLKLGDRGRYLTACCPVPYHPGNGDNPRAFVWSYDKNSWKCYTHGCQEDTGSDIIGFVMSMKEVAFPIAIKYLQQLKNGELKNVSVEPLITKQEAVEENRIINRDKLNLLMPDKYFRGRGIDQRILALHKVGYWQKTGTFMDRRAIVPVFDIDSNLVGFSGRLTIDGEDLEKTEQPKWVHGKDFVTRKAGLFNKMSLLYNLNNAKDLITKTKKVYIVEGPIDCWKMQMAGINNVVATLGIGISFEQIQLLVRLGVETIVLCYDADSAGTKGALRVYEQLKNLFIVEINQPKKGKDFGEMNTKDILENLINGN
jgi:DNA primase